MLQKKCKFNNMQKDVVVGTYGTTYTYIYIYNIKERYNIPIYKKRTLLFLLYEIYGINSC